MIMLKPSKSDTSNLQAFSRAETKVKTTPSGVEPINLAF